MYSVGVVPSLGIGLPLRFAIDKTLPLSHSIVIGNIFQRYSLIAGNINPVYNVTMQAIDDIFGIWPSLGEMAKDLGQIEDTVYRWKMRGRIPEDVWPTVIEKAAAREQLVTASQIMRFNAPIKKRGRRPSISTTA